MKKNLQIFLFCLIFVTTAVNATELKPGDFEGTVDREFFKSIAASLPPDVQVVDTRAPEEYKFDHLEGSANIFVNELYENNGCSSVISKLPKDKKIIFVCSTGGRSEDMYFTLMEQCGYDMSNILYFDGKTKFVNGKIIIE